MKARSIRAGSNPARSRGAILNYFVTMSEKLCLQWNDFKENDNCAFGSLRNDKDFTDVTLACDDSQHLELHKVVLASTSPFFMELLKKNKIVLSDHIK